LAFPVAQPDKALNAGFQDLTPQPFSAGRGNISQHSHRNSCASATKQQFLYLEMIGPAGFADPVEQQNSGWKVKQKTKTWLELFQVCVQLSSLFYFGRKI